MTFASRSRAVSDAARRRQRLDDPAERWTLVALLVLLAAAVGLRVWFLAAYRPTLLGLRRLLLVSALGGAGPVPRRAAAGRLSVVPAPGVRRDRPADGGDRAPARLGARDRRAAVARGAPGGRPAVAGTRAGGGRVLRRHRAVPRARGRHRGAVHVPPGLRAVRRGPRDVVGERGVAAARRGDRRRRRRRAHRGDLDGRPARRLAARRSAGIVAAPRDAMPVWPRWHAQWCSAPTSSPSTIPPGTPA